MKQHMKHPDNGYHICYTQAEVLACEKTGWKKCDYEKEHKAARAAKEKALKDIEQKRIDGEKAVKKSKGV